LPWPCREEYSGSFDFYLFSPHSTDVPLRLPQSFVFSTNKNTLFQSLVVVHPDGDKKGRKNLIEKIKSFFAKKKAPESSTHNQEISTQNQESSTAPDAETVDSESKKTK
jgi:hypothetical protein